MTKFIYVADSHCGANPQQYKQQRPYTEKLPEIISALKKFIAEEKDISFLLHGGDLVDVTSENNIRAAAELFDLEIPVHLCLGNHDLTTPDALQQWLQFAPQFFPNTQPDFSLLTDDCIIHIAPNQWGSAPYYWEEEQRPHFLPQQKTFLENALSAAANRPHLLLTHAPVFDLPPEQTGLNQSLHAPNAEFNETICELAARHPHLLCVLGAHSHLNMCVQRGGTHFVTASALVETPFECKVFEVTRECMAMRTITLGNRMNELGEYDFSKTFVQGRAVDRAFSRLIKN
jgi:3',5'-cyclic AMP phosphodiesterase CpdA